MFCCLCTEEAVHTISAFKRDENELIICSIIEKYFWFKLNEADPLMNTVCSSCWQNVKRFHLFYEKVQKAHKNNFTTFLNMKKEPTYQESEVSCNFSIDKNEDVELLKYTEDDESHHTDPLINNGKTKTEVQNNSVVNTYFPEQELVCNPIEFESNDNVRTQSLRALRKANHKKQNGRISLKTFRPKFKVELRNMEINEKIARVLTLSCDVCGLIEPNYSKLMQHMKETHNVKGYTVCCSKKFTRRHYLSDHIERHLNPDRFKCENCSKNFANKQCLDHHIFLKHKSEAEKVFCCSECGKKFAKQYILDKHQIVHQERNHICEICDKKFHTLSKLKTHVKSVHNSSGNMCDICAKVIMCQTAFKRHLLDHLGSEMPRVQCNICQNWYKNFDVLTKHKRTHEERSIVHKCDICEKITPTRRALISHMRYVHTAERKFECSICHKSFKRAITLREHITLHTGEILYKCPHCPRTFNSNSNMYSHRKKVHPEEFEEARKDRIVNGVTDENKVIKFSV